MKKNRKLLYGAIIMTGFTALIIWAFSPRPLQVEVASASVGPIETSIDEEAKTRLRNHYIISAPLTGQISRIDLREGDVLQQNAIVTSLNPALSPMLDSRTSREQQAHIESSEAMVSRANTRIEQARFALEQTRTELVRSEKLAPKQYVSQNKLEADRIAERIARKDLDIAIEERHVANHQLEQARAALAATEKPRSVNEKSSFKIRSPIHGQILRMHRSSEGIVNLGTPLLEIGNTNDMEIVAELLTTDSLAVKPGTAVRIERWGRPQPLLGRVRRIEPAAFTKVSALGVEEQRVNVLIDIISPREQWQALGDGFRVNVRIITLAQNQVLRVPVSAVFPHVGSNKPNAMAVFTVDQNRAKLVPVTIGARNSEFAWIQSGLSVGNHVIIYPGDTVIDGVRVTPRVVKNVR
jgi:HlyD family secretion protein